MQKGGIGSHTKPNQGDTFGKSDAGGNSALLPYTGRKVA